MKYLFLITFISLHMSAQEPTSSPTPSVMPGPSTQPLPQPMPAPSMNAPTPAYKSLSWYELVQRKYNLSNEDMKLLVDAKLPDPHVAQAAELAKASNKSINEILKMRLEQKMGWGKIAKELGVHPGALGQAVSSLRKDQSDERKKERTDKQRIAKEKQEARRLERAEKRQNKPGRERHEKSERPARPEPKGRSGK